MRIFISSYVLLALAGSSALAAPLSTSERDVEARDAPSSSQDLSQSSSMLMDRQAPNFGPGPELMRLSSFQPNSDKSSPPPDSPPTPASPPKGCDDAPTKSKQLDFKSSVSVPGYPNPIYPRAVATVRRYFQNSMRRRSEGPSDILERDDTANATAPTPDDIFAYYFKKALVGSKRSGPTFDRDVN